MTKFDKSFIANQQLHIFKEELAGQLSFGTWLKRADAYLEGCAALWAEQMPKII